MLRTEKRSELESPNPLDGGSAKGILERRRLPDVSYDQLWDAILLDTGVKDRLLGQAVLNFTLRPKLAQATLPFHGVILLVGPPGTGKTSLARGLASKTARAVSGLGAFQYLEVEPHSLASSSLGKSQQAVTQLLGGAIAEAASAGPLIVVLDEVETLAADRTRVSLESNPIDVHRATDAVLAQLDRLASTHKELLFIATSNFPEAVDSAFVSRADLVATIGLPDQTAVLQILRDTVLALAIPFPRLAALAEGASLARVAKVCAGMDGRQIRKVVLSSLAQDKRVAHDPSALSIDHVYAAAQHAAREALARKGRRT